MRHLWEYVCCSIMYAVYGKKLEPHFAVEMSNVEGGGLRAKLHEVFPLGR